MNGSKKMNQNSHKRIAFFHELDKGGARRSSNEFSKLLRSNFKIDLFLIDEKLNKDEIPFYDSIRFFKFKPKVWKGHDWKVRLYKDTIELFRLYLLHRKIAKEIGDKKYDLVFSFPSKYTQAPFILKFLKIPVIYYCQEPLRMVYEDLFKVGPEVGVGRYYYEKVNRFIRKIIDRENIKKADTILANSIYTSKNIYSAYRLKSTPVYMGVDVDFFSPSERQKKHEILYIGAYDKSENYSLLRKALSKLHLRPEKARLVFKEKEWISGNKAMRDLYRSSKIIICIGYKEPFGLIPIEALSCGLPVVALNDGGYKETVNHNINGLLVKQNSDQLAEAITQILSDERTYRKMSKAARESALNQWSWNNSKQKLLEVIDKTISK